MQHKYTDLKTGIEYVSKQDYIGSCELCEFNYDSRNCGAAAQAYPCSAQGSSTVGIIWIKKEDADSIEACQQAADSSFTEHGESDNPLGKQVGGGHYKSQKIQPVEYIHANNLGFCEGNVVKYITRWKEKGGKADIEKVIHYCQLLMQLEGL